MLRGVRGFPCLKIQKLPNFHFMFLRYMKFISNGLKIVYGIFIISGCPSPIFTISFLEFSNFQKFKISKIQKFQNFKLPSFQISKFKKQRVRYTHLPTNQNFKFPDMKIILPRTFLYTFYIFKSILVINTGSEGPYLIDFLEVPETIQKVLQYVQESKLAILE